MKHNDIKAVIEGQKKDGKFITVTSWEGLFMLRAWKNAKQYEAGKPGELLGSYSYTDFKTVSGLFNSADGAGQMHLKNS